MSTKLIFAALFVLLIAAETVQAGGDAVRGQELAVDCADCHGADSMGDDETPRLAGLEEAYLIEQLQAFKSGERIDENELMVVYTEDLSGQDIADLAAYFSGL